MDRVGAIVGLLNLAVVVHVPYARYPRQAYTAESRLDFAGRQEPENASSIQYANQLTSGFVDDS
jgi:hypothetical protein